jgi:para-aminobenzoate synthetase / 4-amino-4-deoxychorismate lyase
VPSIWQQYDGPLPDPAHGVFETTLVSAGRPVALDAHLARIERSLRELYDVELPLDARSQIEAAADGIELGRLRLTVLPDGAAGVRTADVDPAMVFPVGAAEVAPIGVPGGIGGHKWADRRLLEAAEAELGALPLVFDANTGEALETARGNLFVVSGGAVATPPADGRLLPGVTRAQAIEVVRDLGLELHEQPVDLDSADEIFFTGGVRGVEPYGQASGELTARVAAELRVRWLG